jgi:putative colanic acid biosynthesis acetyltransferase WcaF
MLAPFCEENGLTSEGYVFSKANSIRQRKRGPSFGLGHRAYRALWNITWLLFASWTPPFMRPWRRLLLRMFGAKLGAFSDVRGGARVWYPPNLRIDNYTVIAAGVDCYNMGLIHIGEWTIVSQRAFLCGGTHDYTDLEHRLVVKPIIIEPYCWVAAEAFIGPGVTMKRGAILGARAVTFGDLEPWTLYVGNPARPVKTRQPIG